MDPWVKRLSGEPIEQGKALEELGELLRRRVARAFLGESKVDDSFVDDAVQESLTTILNSLGQFEGKSQFTTWATTLAVRTAIREMRRLRWKDRSLDQMMNDHPTVVEKPSSENNPEARIISSQLIETMYKIMNEELTDKQRQVLTLHLNGVPQAEIGRRLGSNRNAVYKLGFDARKKLKEGLVAAGYSAADLELIGAAK